MERGAHRGGGGEGMIHVCLIANSTTGKQVVSLKDRASCGQQHRQTPHVGTVDRAAWFLNLVRTTDRASFG